ncbi:hypothetical protein JRO89_XS14G0089300 [Xanthoceras sorbifolium]|uniref:Protein kinase domain-containing protein n=1 Tax=Xanthoceras sorbifolium TaxID=99658 RepID=A0ABQ8H4N5_9ROSI|nr:hypothetical protein JRO89_XS14G0089300 [Xanthoceras sorbifolium]
MSTSILLCCSFSFLLIYSFSTPSTATIHSNETDRLALLAIKSQLHDPLGAISSWNNSVPLCLWTGVSCGRRHQRVTVLDLRNQSIGGNLSPFIGNLSFLRSINLGDNNFYGDIPNEVSLLFRLEILILANNSFSGTIPKNLSHCPNLIQFHAYRNSLQGEIPPEIGNLLKLEILYFSENHLTGQLPSSIGNLSSLLQLDVGLNSLSGTIPYSLGRLRSLFYLNLGGNNISGNLSSTVTRLVLGDNQIYGSIPPGIGNLVNLEALSMEKNQISGTIPHDIGKLKMLEALYLDENSLRGSIPASIGILPQQILGITTLSIGLDLSNNLLSGSFPSQLGNLKTLLVLYISGNRRSAQNTSSMLQMDELFPMVSYAELRRATDDFSSSNMIGQGSYGLVYKGTFGEKRTLVAVKVINLQEKGGSRSFISECQALRNIRHRNLVGIVTVCSSIDSKGADFKALIYEYMENGSLEEWLHQNKDQLDASNLSLFQRLNIAIDVACAVEYLHHHCEPPIVHGDLKPCNVLLDQDMVAHVGDFGLSKFLSDTAPETQSSSIGIRGTVGYVAPEYGMGSEVSMPGDVYSLGILLLEMFTGKRPIDSMFTDGLTLHEFAKMGLPERLWDIVEPSLLLEASSGNNNVEKFARRSGEGRVRTEECLVGVLGIGVVCSMESPAERMEMTDVVAKLCGVRENFLGRRI